MCVTVYSTVSPVLWFQLSSRLEKILVAPLMSMYLVKPQRSVLHVPTCRLRHTQEDARGIMHGGKRRGSGRPLGGENCSKHVRLRPSTVQTLNELRSQLSVYVWIVFSTIFWNFTTADSQHQVLSWYNVCVWTYHLLDPLTLPHQLQWKGLNVMDAQFQTFPSGLCADT
jgi:hypothetical protein